MGFSYSKFRRQEPPRPSQPPQLPPPPPPAVPLPPAPPRAAVIPPSTPPPRPHHIHPPLQLPPPPPPPPPPPGPYLYYQYAPYPPQPRPPPHCPHFYNVPRNYGYSYSYGGYNGWAAGPGTSGAPPASPPAPMPVVEQKQARKVKNEVNVHKDSIRVGVDERGLDASYLVSFSFDAVVDGSFTIFYFAKEGANCTFSPIYPEIQTPRRFPFHKGAGQKFCQPSETGIDLGFFDVEELAKPSSNEEAFPLVICAETSHPYPIDDLSIETSSKIYSSAQITQAVLEKDDGGHFQVRVVKQILWNEGVRYELREIYGISSSNAEETGFEDNDPGKECVICMTEPKDTAVMPCRHMCMCRECAKELKLRSNKCPICRQPIQELIEIKVK